MIAKKEINVAVIILQVQFALIFIHSLQLFFIACEYPKAAACIICSYALVFFILFSDYYKRAYKKEQKIKVKTGIFYYKLTLLFCFVCLFHFSVAQTAVHTVHCHCGYPVLVGIATRTG
jgi:integral membrane sensor domain MASE1